MIEQWEKWEPLQGLAEKYYTHSVSNGPEGLKVILSEYPNENTKVVILFEGCVGAYRETDEGFRLTTMSALGKKYGPEFYGDWTFFRVTNSSYMQWLFDESYIYENTLAWKHFCFVAAESFIDVIATYEPTIEILSISEELP